MKYKDIFKKIDSERKQRTYYLTKNRRPPAVQVQERSKPKSILQYYDEETGQNRLIRYSATHASPFQDEQEGKWTFSTLWFEDGILMANKRDLALQKFLALHPDNVANGGRKFFEFDPSAKAEKQIENMDAEVDALIEVKGLTTEQLEFLMWNLYDNEVFQTPLKELRRDAYISAKKEPNKVLALLQSPDTNLRGLAAKALYENVLIVEGAVDRTVKWGHGSKTKVCPVPSDLTAVDAIAKYFTSDKGDAVMAKVKEKLG